MIANLWQDLRYGARMLMKNPGFTLIAVMTLALGIGANTAVFSFINPLLFKPLRGVAESERLAQVSQTHDGRGFSDFSYPDYLDYRDHNTVMSGLAVRAGGAFNLNDGREAERVEGEMVSGNYFDVLGVKSERGRLLTPADDSGGGGNPVVVISHGLWRRRFDAAPDVIGKTIKLNSKVYTVVGVADEEFEGTKAGAKMDVWVTITTLGQMLSARGGSRLEVFGRLKPGVTIERANAEFSTIALQLEHAYPDTNAKDGARVDPDLGMDPEVRMLLRQFTFIPFAAVGIVLLIACANVAGLLLARSNARRKEIGTRLAVGASRGRIARQLLTESLMLALLGGAFGILIGAWMTRGVIGVLPIRSTANPAQLAAAVRREAGALDPNLPVYRIAPLEDHFTAALTPQRVLTQLISGFGLLALALAGAGLYGSLAYSVSQRTQEIGIRVALGAQGRDVLRLVVLDGMKLTLLGLAIGLPASYGLTKLMKSYLYGVSLTDPLTFAVISATLLAVTLAACYAPARRATKVDPMIALRCE